jgi:hypothetical protein
LRSRVAGSLAAERKIESGYAELTRTALRDAGARAERGDVRGLQQVIARALSTDERLGYRRPDAMTALLATLDLRLDEAKRLRVVQEAWAARADVFRAYQRAVDGPRRRLNSFRARLEQIRSRRNVSARNLERLEIQATMALQDLQRVEPPPELQAAHGLYVSAFHMTRTAASLRRNALSSKHNTTLAWDASSAAAGALMLAERAAGEVNRLISASSNSSR